MNLVFCLGNGNGMMFANRRQSRDGAVIADLAEEVKDSRLLIAPYSAPLFENTSLSVTVCEDLLSAAEAGDFCFVEDRNADPIPETAETIYLYRWNRDYPADLRFTGDLRGFRLISSRDFSGSSHEKITKEVWSR